MASEIVDNGPSDPDEAEEWLNSPEYQEFVARAAKHCRCECGPCDGVLAGGMCDEIGKGWHEDDEAFCLYDEEDEEW